MQVAQGQILIRVYALVLSTIGWCILLLPVPKMVLTLCNLRWWCFCYHQLAHKHNLHYIVVAITCNLHWWCFSYANLPMHVLVCTSTYEHALQRYLALCGGVIVLLRWWYIVCIYVCVCVRTVCLWCFCHVLYVCLCICMCMRQEKGNSIQQINRKKMLCVCLYIHVFETTRYCLWINCVKPCATGCVPIDGNRW